MKLDDFPRMKLLPPYAFAVVEEEKARRRAAGEDIIDFGLGNPDEATPAPIVAAATEALQKTANHRYTISRGFAELRQALSRWYKRRYDVDIDPEHEAVVTLGAKEGLSHLFLATLAPGDVVLSPNPCYPIHAYGPLIAGGVVRDYPIGPGRDHLADIAHAYEGTRPRPKWLLLNFPHNPTSATCTTEFFREVLAFAEKHDLWVIQDLAYADMQFEAGRAPSMLQQPGAKERCVEFFSMSKSYNMPGWRVGYCAGNRALVGALTRIKGYLDYGIFAPIQLAAAYALDHGDEFTDQIRALYQRRRDELVGALTGAGWSVEPPRATMFLWAPIPERFRALGSVEFSRKLLADAKVAVSPGAAFGSLGDGYVRFAFIEESARVQKAAEGIRRMLK